MTDTAGRCSLWEDQSANGRDFSSGTGPTIVNDNGTQILRFNSEQMSATAWAQANEATIYAVVKVTNSATWKWMIGKLVDANVGIACYAVGGATFGNPEPTLDWASVRNANGDFPTDIADGSYHVLRWTYQKGATGQRIVSRDYGSWARQLGADAAVATWGKIGTTTAGFQFQGDLKSIAITDKVVTKAEHRQYLDYFHGRWNTPGAVTPASGHRGYIWCVGDSLTLGLSTSSVLKAGYRRFMWNRMRVGGYGGEFVGSKFPGQLNGGGTDGYVGAPDATYGDPSPDNEHDGVGGRTIQQMQDAIVGLMDALDAAGERPNTWALCGGANDILQGIESGASSRLQTLATTIFARYPTSRGIICTLPGFVDAGNEAKAVTLNTAISGTVVPNLQGLGYDARLADVHAQIVNPGDFEADGVHLKSTPGSGYDHMSLPIYNAFIA